MITMALNPAFEKRFIEVHTGALFLFICNNFDAWYKQRFILNAELEFENISPQKVNAAVKDMLHYFMYEYREAVKRTIDGTLTRAKIIVDKQPGEPYIEYDSKRAYFLKRFLNNYETHLYKGITSGKLKLKHIVSYYDYWFKYRRISRVFGYSNDEIILLYAKHLEQNGYTCVTSSTHIIYRKDKAPS